MRHLFRYCMVFILSILFLGVVNNSINAATEEEIIASIEAGIAWLVPMQDPVTGSWSTWEGVAYTGFVVVKLEDRAYELGYESPFDPEYEYNEAVAKGLNFILGSAISATFLFLIIIWIYTFLAIVPIHMKLKETPSSDLINSLVHKNWLRTILWTLKGFIILFMYLV